jgi:hypothetical protein
MLVKYVLQIGVAKIGCHILWAVFGGVSWSSTLDITVSLHT